MIKSKKDLKYYLKCDQIALGKISRARPAIVHDEIWRFEILLRKAEYYKNCKKSIFGRLFGMYIQYKYYKLRLKYNTYIPLNVFGPGLSIAHFGSIVVNGNAKVGKNCRIQESVTIGATNGEIEAPQLGNNIFIGSGARIIGNIKLGNDIAIGANAVVVNDINENGISVAGVPAKKISNNNSHSNLNYCLKKEGLL